MTKGIRLLVWGEYALFTRPEMKAERVSYDVITPSAARAIVSAIYWKPQIQWVIDKIHVLKPIRFTSIRRNEVSDKMSSPQKEAMEGKSVDRMGIEIEDCRAQRASLVLKDVAYVIEAHFEVLQCTLEKGGPVHSREECEAKHISMFNRRASEGQAFQQPYFGCREFPAFFRLLKEDEPCPDTQLPGEQKDKDFGFMLHDFIYRDDSKGIIINSNTKKKMSNEARFFRAIMKDGVIDIPSLTSTEVKA